MKEYTLKTISNDGEVVGESKLTLKEGSTLIIKHTENKRIDEMVEWHKYIKEMLLSSDDKKLISLPYGVELQVLEANEDKVINIDLEKVSDLVLNKLLDKLKKSGIRR